MAAAPLTVEGILNGINSIMGSITQQEVEAGGNFDQVTGLLKKNADEATSVGQDAVLVETTKQTAEANRQASVADFMKQIDFEGVKSRLADTLNREGAAMESAMANISKKNSVSFMDNPFAWIGAQVSVQKDISQYNASVDKFNLADKHMTAVNNIAQEVAQTSLQTIQTVTAETAAASGRVAAFQYNQVATENQIKAAVNDTARLKFLREADADKIQMATTAYNVQNSERQMVMHEANFRMRQQEFQLNYQELQRKVKDRAEQESLDDQVLNQINAGAKYLGRRPFANKNDYKAFVATASKESKDTVQRMAEIGYDILGKAASGQVGSIQIGASPADTALTVVGTRGTFPSSSAVDNMLKTTYQLVASGATGVDLKNANAVKNDLNGRLLGGAKRDSTDIMTGPANIYHPPTWSEVITVLGTDAKLPAFYQKVLKAEVANNPNAVVDPQVMWKRALTAVQNKQVSFDEAVKGMNSLAGISAAVNNTVRNYGSAALPQQSSFIANFKLTDSALFKKSVNMMDYASTTNAFAAAVAVQSGAFYGINSGGKPAELPASTPAVRSLPATSGDN